MDGPRTSSVQGLTSTLPIATVHRPRKPSNSQILMPTPTVPSRSAQAGRRSPAPAGEARRWPLRRRRRGATGRGSVRRPRLWLPATRRRESEVARLRCPAPSGRWRRPPAPYGPTARPSPAAATGGRPGPAARCRRRAGACRPPDRTRREAGRRKKMRKFQSRGMSGWPYTSRPYRGHCRARKGHFRPD